MWVKATWGQLTLALRWANGGPLAVNWRWLTGQSNVGPTETCCWPNVVPMVAHRRFIDVGATVAQRWTTGAVKRLWYTIGPTDSPTLCQPCLPTWAQRRGCGWPNVGPMVVCYLGSASPSYEASRHVKNYAYSGKLLLVLSPESTNPVVIVIEYMYIIFYWDIWKSMKK